MENAETGRKMDRRTRYTRQIIRDTLLELMGEKGFSHVTVTEVCKQAELNRGTFYLHYLDLNDVLDFHGADVRNHLCFGPCPLF